MEEVFVVASIITLCYSVSKFMEWKYMSEETTPLKDIVRDCFLVLMSSLSGSYLYFHFQSTIREFFNVVTETKVLNSQATQVFTDNPNF